MDRKRINSPRAQSRQDQWFRLLIESVQTLIDVTGTIDTAGLALNVSVDELEGINTNIQTAVELTRDYLAPATITWTTSVETDSTNSPVSGAESISVKNTGTIDVTFNGETLEPGQIREACVNFQGSTIADVSYTVPVGGELTVQTLS